MLETQQNDTHLGAVLRRVDSYFEKLDLPKLEADVEAPKVISISDLEDCTNKDLENYLLLFGGFRSYLDTKLASVESRKTILEATFEKVVTFLSPTTGSILETPRRSANSLTCK